MSDPQKPVQRPVPPSGNSIDLTKILMVMWRIFTQIWGRMTILALVIMLLFTGYEVYTFQPEYETYVTYAVSKGTSTDDDIQLASRISSSFQYLIWSSGFYRDLYNDLGIITSRDMPVTLKASYVEETNFVTIKANANVKSQAVTAINSLVEKFPEMVLEVAGSAAYSIVDRSGTTDIQTNEFSLPKFILIGAALGIFAVLCILFLLAYTSDSVRSYEDLKQHIRVPLIGGIPLLKVKKSKRRDESYMTLYNSKISEKFREAIYQIRSRIESEMRDKNIRTLLISSSVPGEGKTTFSVNLAIAMAERGEKVLLIDGDIRNPSVASAMGFSASEKNYGIMDVLRKKVDFETAVIKTEINQPDLLLGKNSVGNPAKYFASDEMEDLIDTAADLYDYVIIDTPPSAMMVDASVLARYVDAVTYVIRQDYTRVRSIEEGIDMLSSNEEVELLGLVFNCVETGYGRYGYGKYGRYGYGYGYSYRSRKGQTPVD